MKEHLAFLKICSMVVKVSAWIFLSMGVLGGFSVMFGQVPGNPKWVGAIVLLAYVFLFFLLHLIAQISDLLVKISDGIGKEKAE